ncbi:IS3 family transposase [Kitasatospora sp. NPDC091257]|uniref:IS3 family transposase n=1 Tax=unclassified Kitasatospora TaxID=2633591 RepID=UPI002F90AA04
MIHLASRGAYGVPRVHAELRRQGRAVNRKKVERIMRERGITGVTRRRRRGLTRQARKPVFVPDLIGRDFTAPRPGMRLVGDMTCLPTEEGWLYLTTCIDLATREVVGYAMADHHRAELPVAALRMAAGRGGLERGCIFHSDRGSEYTSTEFRTEISKLGMRQSMGRVGSCYDNAVAESFFAVLKEEIGTRIWPDRATARAEIFAFIETFCASTPSGATSPHSRSDSDTSKVTPWRRRRTVSNRRVELHPPPAPGPEHRQTLWARPRARWRLPGASALDHRDYPA